MARISSFRGLRHAAGSERRDGELKKDNAKEAWGSSSEVDEALSAWFRPGDDELDWEARAIRTLTLENPTPTRR